MKSQSNEINTNAQCMRQLSNIENNIDLILAAIAHTNEIITAWIADPVNKRS